MSKALYRKYRSKKLGEIVGQEHITTTLQNALKKGAISHAYLFTGPRGVGKTSIARILAHEVNSLPYDEAATHLDIIEIDAASNRRIDEIRTLRERVHNAPTSAKYKVYIIDEVHMLTKEAFNALLKTLEEPPDHVIFILATTESHKLPETIISRTQRFSFKPIERSAAVAHLRHIADEEDIKVDDDALELIAEHGGGSFRDSISLLDQVSNTGAVVDLAAAQRMLGIAPHDAIRGIIQTLSNGETSHLLETMRQLHEQGYQAPQIAKQLAQELRAGMLDGTSPLTRPSASKLMHRLIDVPAAHDPDALLEIILLDVVLEQPKAKAVVPEPVTLGSNPISPAKDPPTPPKSEQPTPPSKPVEPIEPPKPEPETEALVSKPKPSSDPAVLDEKLWQQVLTELKKKYNTLYGVARMADPMFEPEKLTLTFKFPFHQKRMDDTKNKQIMNNIMQSLVGHPVEIVCIIDDIKSKTLAKDSPNINVSSSNNTVDKIADIFGGAEVLD